MLEWILPVNKLIWGWKSRFWCKLPYPGHPKGCPNYGIKDHCPPKSLLISKIFNLNKPTYLVFSTFDLAAHMEKMKHKYPHWTERQLRNVYYWQNISRAQLKERMMVAIKLLGTNAHTFNPESNGVNMYATAYHSGLKLEKIKTLKTCHHIGIIGWK